MAADSPLVATVSQRLARAGCVAAEEEAEELVAAATGEETLEAWIRRRERGEPLAWITGTVTFCGHNLHIESGVYVPRHQSEELARRAALLLREAKGRAADLCTGCGAVALHLAAEVPSATVVGVDLDSVAVANARRNGVNAIQGDLGQSLRGESFDVVTAVAPYVPAAEIRFLPADVQRYEPRLALDGGSDGLDTLRRIVDCAARLLRPAGWLLAEAGGGQDRALRPHLSRAGFGSALPWFDEDGDLRGLATRLGAAR